MGTRSITHIHEMKDLRSEDIVCSFYRHWGGSTKGHGKDLLKWLKNKKLVNGIGRDFVDGRDFNRAGTMAVQLMSHIQYLSGCEVVPTGSCCMGEEFVYDIYFREDFFEIIVTDVYSDKIFTMKVKDQK